MNLPDYMVPFFLLIALSKSDVGEILIYIFVLPSAVVSDYLKMNVSMAKFISWSNGLVVKALYSQSRGPVSRGPCSKPLGGSKVDSAFHPSEVDKMSTRNFWELSGKK